MTNMTTNTMTYADRGAENQGFIARMRKSYADHRMYRRTLDELQGLSDRELTDLNLSRFSLRQVAYESVYGA